MHGQLAKAPSRAGNAPRHAVQLAQDQIGTIDNAVVHVFGIGASASGSDVVLARDFGFDIAPDRDMCTDPAFDIRKPFALGIEPVEVSIESDRDLRFLFRREPLDKVERGEISVEAADDIKNVGA